MNSLDSPLLSNREDYTYPDQLLLKDIENNSLLQEQNLINIRETINFHPEQMLLDDSYNNYHPSEQISSICPICEEFKPLRILSSCFHSFCDSCLTTYIEIRVSESNVLSMPCPMCSTQLADSDLFALMSVPTHEKYTRFLSSKKAEENLYLKWCPKPNCHGFDVALPDNYHLHCNACGHEYCYSCSQAWHKGKCKKNSDTAFSVWAMMNNVKICPRCKNHVQKNGGCPHMSCPRCGHSWCWICGGDYRLPDHSFTCMLGRNKLELYWGIIFLLLLFPAMLPFLGFLFVVFLYEGGSIDEESLKGWMAVFRWRIVVYPFAFLLSPAAECVGLFIAYSAFMIELTNRNRHSVNGVLDFAFRLILASMICNVFAIGAILIIAVIAAIAPLAGVFFVFTKLYFTLARCCKPRSEFEYPRFLL
jgi:hypothetical protein